MTAILSEASARRRSPRGSVRKPYCSAGPQTVREERGERGPRPRGLPCQRRDHAGYQNPVSSHSGLSTSHPTCRRISKHQPDGHPDHREGGGGETYPAGHGPGDASVLACLTWRAWAQRLPPLEGWTLTAEPIDSGGRLRAKRYRPPPGSRGSAQALGVASPRNADKAEAARRPLVGSCPSLASASGRLLLTAAPVTRTRASMRCLPAAPRSRDCRT